MKHLKHAFFAITFSLIAAGCSSKDDSAVYQHPGSSSEALPADASTAQQQQQQVSDIYAPTTTTPEAGQQAVATSEYAPSAQPPTADTGNYSSIDYTVTEGDSLWKIARKHNTNVSRIKEANGLTSDNIRPGQVIKVPVPQP